MAENSFFTGNSSNSRSTPRRSRSASSTPSKRTIVQFHKKTSIIEFERVPDEYKDDVWYTSQNLKELDYDELKKYKKGEAADPSNDEEEIEYEGRGLEARGDDLRTATRKMYAKVVLDCYREQKKQGLQSDSPTLLRDFARPFSLEARNRAVCTAKDDAEQAMSYLGIEALTLSSVSLMPKEKVVADYNIGTTTSSSRSRSSSSGSMRKTPSRAKSNESSLPGMAGWFDKKRKTLNGKSRQRNAKSA